MQKRTKIIATLGPATQHPDVLRKIFAAGVDLVRVNMSHSCMENHLSAINNTRKIAKELNKEVGILVDLQGPKLRIAKFKEKSVELKKDEIFILDPNLNINDGDQHTVGIDYQDLYKDVKTDDVLLFDDGRVIMTVIKVDAQKIHCIVTTGGILTNNKGFNKQGGGLSAKAITGKDKQDILFSVENKVDYIGLSFVKSAQDLLEVRETLEKLNSKIGILAKIERIEAINVLDEIIAVSDGVMVARGDLGVELGFAELPVAQKHIINTAKELNKIVIVATQMMESMIVNSVPTRAEVSDVANAILEGTDAVMLSGETAVGAYPVQVIESVTKICLATERQKVTQTSYHRINSTFHRTDEAIAMAAMYVANHLQIKAIIVLTETGATPLLMSRIRSKVPIYGISRNELSLGKMTLYRGVYPIIFDIQLQNKDPIVQILSLLLKKGNLKKEDKVIVTYGDVSCIEGHTNTMKIITV